MSRWYTIFLDEEFIIYPLVPYKLYVSAYRDLGEGGNGILHDKWRLKRLSLSYWSSGGGLSAWVFTLLLTACTILIVLLNMSLNKWQVGFYNQLQQYDFSGFIDSLLQFIAIAGIYVFASGYQSYFQMSLEIRWRHWLTDKYLTLWLDNQTYYRLNLIHPAVNPDQRISEDVRLFIANTLELSVGLLRHFVMLLVFSIVLWQLSGTVTVFVLGRAVPIPGYLLWLALLYSALGTWIIVQIGKPLIGRNVLQQSNEADFRSGLIRVREADECVALYSGEPSEKQSLTIHFQKIMNNYRRIIKYTKTVTFISTAYSQLSVVLAFLIASPHYFNHELQLGHLFEISGAYWYVHSALAYIIDSFNKIALWKAVARRLDNFSFQMSDANCFNSPQGIITFTSKHHLKLKNLTVRSPANRDLLNNLTLELKPQDKFLISGPTGCGKTTLLRTIAGLWPYFTGAIVKPAAAVVFLPQKSYTPPGFLRDTLLYSHVGENPSDQQLNELLERCNLSILIGKLDHCDDWGKILSLGEQQCLAFARAILKRPDWLFLDEATSNMDEQTEQSLYRLLTEIMPDLTMVSVGHRETLRPFHTLSLNLNGAGAWDIAALGTSRLQAIPRHRLRS